MRVAPHACSGSKWHCANMAVRSWTCVWGPLLLVGIFTGFITALEVTVLDTRTYETLDWSRYSASNKGATWREATYNTPSSDTQRIYTVCQVTKEEVRNWLRTPFIPRGEAKRIYIEMTFTMRRCTKFPEPGLLQQCKESFKLLYYESDTDIANATYPQWNTSVYKHKDVIAADSTFTDINNAVSNMETRDIAVMKKGVYFAFFDEGGCTTLLSIRIYYIMCKSVTVKFATFPNTTTGLDETAVVPREGVCVNNAAIEKPPKNLCNQNGQWIFLDGGCKCMPGYEPHKGDKECKGCEVGKYKWRTGSESCLPCPTYSEAPNTKSVECRCRSGYHRNVNDDKSMPCTRPPSKVRNITVTYHDPSMVNLSWRQPQDLGGRRDLFYTVECLGCEDDDRVFYVPKRTGFNTTKVSVMGLEPDKHYKLLVYAMNGVSELSGTQSSSFIVAKTDKAVNIKVKNLRLVSADAYQVMLQWDAPNGSHGGAELYEVTYYVKGLQGNTTRAMLSQVTSITIVGLQPSSEYYFLVRVKTANGWGEYLKPFSVTTAKGKESKISTEEGRALSDSQKVNKSDNSAAIIAGSAVAVVACMIIVIIMVVLFLRKNQRACHEKNVSDCDNLHYTNGEVQCARLVDGTRILNNGLTLPLFTQPGVLKSYIDPHTYEDPNQAVREFTKEIDASLITIESVLGGGEFGDVCKGYLSHHGKRIPVAIKTLKSGASDKNRLDFLTEASIMGQFDDPNVIFLEGVVTKSNPIMIVTEYMENGALDAFLRTNDGKFTVMQLVGLLRGIAAGMCYLSDMGYVHRDLAARNILMNEGLVCKVADFGLSREIESDDLDGAYTTKGGKIPVRWTAPEAIAYRKFTSASDCWSYGIVMWEVMSYGERPYWNWSNQDVIKAVEKGFRLTAPMDCPEAVHQLMLDCWQKERSNRPKFADIVKTIDKLIRAPELLRKISKPRPNQFLNPNMPDLTQLMGIEDWLTSIKMERYAENFSAAGYTRMDQVAQITPKNLENLGITLAGHQKKIMNSVQMLRVQLGGAQVSEGFLV